jgi:hypothetical protein
MKTMSLAESRIRARTGLDYKTVRGYVVQGSDENSFQPCGASKVYLIEGPPGPRFILTQRYRYAAISPLTPVFFEFSAAFLDSAVSVGPNNYSAVVYLKEVMASTKAPANCPRPRRGSLVSRERLLS